MFTKPKIYITLKLLFGLIILSLSICLYQLNATKVYAAIPGGQGEITAPTSTASPTPVNTNTSDCSSADDSNNALCGTCVNSTTDANDCINTTNCEQETGNSTCADTAASACTSTNCDLVKSYLDKFVLLLSTLIGVTVVLSLIVAGIQYSSSGGDPQKVTAAKSRITKTITALVAYVFLFALLQFLIPGGIITGSIGK
jgi:hypothetical protein